MSFYYYVILLLCHSTIMSFYYVILLLCHSTIMSFYYYDTHFYYYIELHRITQFDGDISKWVISEGLSDGNVRVK